MEVRVLSGAYIGNERLIEDDRLWGSRKDKRAKEAYIEN